MIPDGDPDYFTRLLYGCEADEIAEAVLLTPMDSTLEALKRRAENVREFKGFNYGFNGNLGGTEVSVINSRIGSPVASDCTYYDVLQDLHFSVRYPEDNCRELKEYFEGLS